MKKFYFLSLLLFFAIFVALNLLVGLDFKQHGLFIDISMLIWFTLSALVLLLATFSPMEIGSAFAIAFRNACSDVIDSQFSGYFPRQMSAYAIRNHSQNRRAWIFLAQKE